MLAIVKEHRRDQASLELRFLHAISAAVPACFDGKQASAFEKREGKLIREIHGNEK